MSKLLHIQFLRGLAALSVAFLHAEHDAVGLTASAGNTFAALRSIPFMAGVDVFFVISGFVMVYASRPLFGKADAPGVFLARRIARIVPLYWSVTTLYLAVALAAPFLLNQPPPSLWLVVASYLFVPAARPDGVLQPLYSLGWTLNYEMFFYALFALVIALPLRAALTRLMAMLVGLALVGCIVWLSGPVAFWTDPIILEFAFGVGLGWLQSRGVTLGRATRWGFVAIALALLIWGGADFRGGMPIMRPFIWGIPAALLVAAAALREDRAGMAGGFTRFCAFLGDISYAIYLIHPFVIRGASELAVRTGAAPYIAPLGFVIVTMAGTVAAAWIVHWTFEKPATAFMRRRMEKAAAV